MAEDGGRITAQDALDLRGVAPMKLGQKEGVGVAEWDFGRARVCAACPSPSGRGVDLGHGRGRDLYRRSRRAQRFI